MIELEMGKYYRTKNSNKSDLIFKYNGQRGGHMSISVIRDLDVFNKRFSTDKITLLHDGSYVVYNSDTVLMSDSKLLAYLL